MQRHFSIFFLLTGFWALSGCDVRNRPATDPAELFERSVELFEEHSFPQAEIQLNQALELYLKQRDGSQAARVLGYLGRIKLDGGQYRSAIEKFQGAIDQSRTANDYRAESQMNMYYGDVLLELGDYAKAIERYQGALSYYAAFNDKKASAEIELRIARAHQWAGEWVQALQLYERAHSYYGSTNEQNAKGEASGGVGEVYALQGRHPEALNSFTQALTALGSSGDPVVEAKLRMNAGLSHSALGNPNAALEQLRNAANLLRSSRLSPNLEARTLFHIGNIYYYNGRYGDAKGYYVQASTVAQAAGDRIAEQYNQLYSLRCDELLLQSADAQKGIDQLLQSYGKVVDAFQACGNRSGEAYARAQQGRILALQGKISPAEDALTKAIKLEESIVGEYLHQEFHRPYLNELYLDKEKSRWYNALAEISLTQGRNEESLQLLEQGSGKSYYDRLRDVELAIRHPQLKQEVPATREKIRQVRLLEIELTRLMSSGERTVPDEQIQSIRGEISSVKQELLQSVDRIAAMQPNYEPLVQIGKPAIAEYQSAIPRGTVILRFLPAADKLYIFVLSRTKLDLRTSPVKREQLFNAASEYKRLMNDPSVYAGAGGASSVPAMTRFAVLSSQLYDYLLRPVDGLFDRNLLIVPGSEFEGFPFHAIERQDQKGNVQYVVEFMSVDYLPSLSSLKYKTALSIRTKDVIAFGNPTGKNWSVDYELRDIRSFYKGANVHIGLEASWQGLSAGRGDVLQLSTDFGSGKTSRPLGMFVLSGGETQGESNETPFEKLSELQVFPVVYLSNQLGEGSGLTPSHALFLRMAGTGDLFLNAWYADRKAAKFFSEFFYTNLANGLAPGDAYRQALLNMIQTKDVNHPRAWGQYFHFGTG